MPVKRCTYVIYLFAFVLASCSSRTEQAPVVENSDPARNVRSGTLNSSETGVGFLKEITTAPITHTCSAVMLCEGNPPSKQVILTASHCLHSQLTFTNTSPPGTGVGVSSTEKAELPIHDSASKNDGLAILRLNSPLSGAIRRLPNGTGLKTDDLATVVGYGHSATAPDLNGKRNSGQVKFTRWDDSSRGEPGALLKLLPGASNQIMCAGDSGGAILNAKNELVGINSHVNYSGTGNGCADVSEGYAFNVTTLRARNFIEGYKNAWCENKSEISIDAHVLDNGPPPLMSVQAVLAGNDPLACSSTTGNIFGEACKQKFTMGPNVTVRVDLFIPNAPLLREGEWYCRYPALPNVEPIAVASQYNASSQTRSINIALNAAHKGKVHCSWYGKSSAEPTVISARTVKVSAAPVREVAFISDSWNRISCGGDLGLAACEAKYNHTDEIRLTAAPRGFQSGIGFFPFISWAAAPSKRCDCLPYISTTCVISAGSTDQDCRAIYASTPREPILTVRRFGPKRRGITSDPVGLTLEGNAVEMSKPFPFATPVKLIVAPGTDALTWEGACQGTGECTVFMDRDKEVTARFVNPHSVRVFVDTPNGKVTAFGNGISDCRQGSSAAACTASKEDPFSIHLTATPDTDPELFGESRYELEGWSGGCTGKANPCLIEVNGAMEVHARFTLKKHSVTVSTRGKGTGTLGFDPPGEACDEAPPAGSICRKFLYRTDVRILQQAVPGSQFAYFLDTGRNETITAGQIFGIRENRTVVAQFDLPFRLDVSRLSMTSEDRVTSVASPDIDCGTRCTSSFSQGQSITLHAEPGPGRHFFGWNSSACASAGTGDCTITFGSSVSVSPNFGRARQLRVLPRTAGVLLANRGVGRVTSDLPGIQCGPEATTTGCHALYKEGDRVRLTAFESVGSKFVGWNGSVNTSDLPMVTHEVVMDADKEVTVDFRLLYTLSITFSGNGSGRVGGGAGPGVRVLCDANCSTTLPRGIGFRIEAVGRLGSSFVKWTGGCTGAADCHIPASGNLAVDAEFSTVKVEAQACVPGTPVFPVPPANVPTVVASVASGTPNGAYLSMSPPAGVTGGTMALEQSSSLNGVPGEYRQVVEVAADVKNFPVRPSPFANFFRVGFLRPAAGAARVFSLPVETPPDPRAFQIVVGPGPGQTYARLFNTTGTPIPGALGAIFPYGGFSGGFSVATGDLTNDGIPEIITGAGPGGGPHVLALNGKNGTVVRSLFAYGASFSGGVHVASADMNGDGVTDIITAPRAGGGPHVRIFSGTNGAILGEFLAYGASFTGGVTVAAGDINNDGTPDIITGAGPGGGPHVRVFDGRTRTPIRELMAFDPAFTAGVFVASADIDGNGTRDIVVGCGSAVRYFNGQTMSRMGEMAFAANGGSVRVASGDLDGDGRAEIAVASGVGSSPFLRVFRILPAGGGQQEITTGINLPYQSNFTGSTYLSIPEYPR